MPSGLPGSEEPAEDHQLSDVIGIVVGDEHCFSENGLTLAVRNGRKKVRVGIFDQGLHRSEVGTEAYHARSEEHTSELQSLAYLVCRLLLEKKKDLTCRLKLT